MKKLAMIMAVAGLMLAGSGTAQAYVAGYSDFSANVIRDGTSGTYTTSATSNATDETFTITAVGGGKVAIGTSAMNGLKVSDFQNFSFDNSVSGISGGQIVYPNAWITDGGSNYAFLAMHYSVGAAQNDDPVYNAMVSEDGLASVFDTIGLRVYATGSDVSWILPGAVKMSKGGSWATALWKSSDTNVYDPVRLSDIGALLFGSPFTSSTIPGVSPNAEWTYAGTGDPQMPDTWYLMCGDTSGSVENYDYTLSNLNLQYVPEPATMALLALGGFGVLIRRSKTCLPSAGRQVRRGGKRK